MSGSGRGMRKTTRRNPCIASLSLLSRCSYYLKPDENDIPRDLAAKGVRAVRGFNAETGKLLLPATAEVEEDEE